jgi:hypothetical protein
MIELRMKMRKYSIVRPLGHRGESGYHGGEKKVGRNNFEADLKPFLVGVEKPVAIYSMSTGFSTVSFNKNKSK